MKSSILTRKLKEVLLKILEGWGEDLLFIKILRLKNKKNCLEYFSKNTPRDMCNILLQSVQI